MFKQKAHVSLQHCRTKIEWYPGKCLTQKLLKKKSRRGGKIITKTEKCESFFNFFNTPHIPEDVDEIDEDDVSLIHLSIKVGLRLRRPG